MRRCHFCQRGCCGFETLSRVCACPDRYVHVSCLRKSQQTTCAECVFRFRVDETSLVSIWTGKKTRIRLLFTLVMCGWILIICPVLGHLAWRWQQSNIQLFQCPKDGILTTEKFQAIKTEMELIEGAQELPEWVASEWKTLQQRAQDQCPILTDCHGTIFNESFLVDGLRWRYIKLVVVMLGFVRPYFYAMCATCVAFFHIFILGRDPDTFLRLESWLPLRAADALCFYMLGSMTLEIPAGTMAMKAIRYVMILSALWFLCVFPYDCCKTLFPREMRMLFRQDKEKKSLFILSFDEVQRRTQRIKLELAACLPPMVLRQLVCEYIL